MIRNAEESTVEVGAPSDTGPVYKVTITRDADDTETDWTTATEVKLVDPDGTLHPVTVVTAAPDLWVGEIRYNAFWSAGGDHPTVARAWFSDGTHFTLKNPLVFRVGRQPAWHG